MQQKQQSSQHQESGQSDGSFPLTMQGSEHSAQNADYNKRQAQNT